MADIDKALVELVYDPEADTLTATCVNQSGAQAYEAGCVMVEMYREVLESGDDDDDLDEVWVGATDGATPTH